MQTVHPARTIANVVIPRSAITTAALMVGFALLTAFAAQIRIPIPGTPVPITAQTFAVLLAGAALGSRLGAGSQLLYWALGAAGLPVYANASGGWETAIGATGGYLFGFIVAAWAVGYLAERGRDRKVATAIPAFLAGNTIIYLIGVPWLMVTVPAIDSLNVALAAGFVPFVIGDVVKIAAAGLLLPAAWKLIDTARR